MKAWFINGVGEPNEVLDLQNTSKPEPSSKEVLVKVEAAALNFFDILQCQGKYQETHETPYIPGAEIAGIVEASDGEAFSKGQRVLATPLLPNGGLAEWVTVKKVDVFPIPDELSFSEAAAFFITYQTAYFALHRTGRIKAGEVLLVHAGSGGVGSAAIQLGKAAGAYVIATAGSDEKLEICRQLGADVVINYRTENFIEIVKKETNGKGANIIFDPVGGDTFDQSRKCIAFEGRILVIGFAGGRIADAPTNHALIKNYSIVGVHFGLFRKLYPDEVKKAHDELMKLFLAGKIRPLIYQEYLFEDVPEALDHLADRKTYGKLVVTP
ncbi:NADPH2:quinone reductase [Psychrobacillus sp. OK028]|uniref:NADPH:quinone oxidoreductase family protein n=1 Tax=Psychrobacillus sp. OK028 TaxID=1884359 RepID=UPI0008885691|nr:NADPH:quinone oxidoreductase family protein [Psychrobacillus sp. OK028]SDM40037.1 NADPH2:quinone reductase [Psychrobacillus sp. OK028]